MPTLAILQQSEWRCPAEEVIDAMDAGNRTELWQTRMRELSGAIMISALFQVFIGFFGINILIFFTLMLIHIINQKVRLFGCIDVCRS